MGILPTPILSRRSPSTFEFADPQALITWLKGQGFKTIPVVYKLSELARLARGHQVVILRACGQASATGSNVDSTLSLLATLCAAPVETAVR